MQSARLVFNYEGSLSSRLDKVLLDCVGAEPDFSDITRSQLKKYIDLGQVKVNSQPVLKSGYIINLNDLIEINIEKQESKLEPYNFPLNIVYEDDDLIVLDKPAKISMHPGVGNHNKTLLNAVYYYLGENLQPQIVHRLDQNTSGLVVIAKNEAVAAKLSLQFAERSVDRNYQALVAVTPKAKRAVQINDSGRIETLIGRHAKNRLLMAVITKGGRNAITNWTRIEKMSYACLLDVKLETGRTHQIRVHMQYLGSPVIGDPDYIGEELLPIELKTIANNFGRQALHAYRLGFDHPTSGERILFESKLPEDFQKLINDFRAYGF